MKPNNNSPDISTPTDYTFEHDKKVDFTGRDRFTSNLLYSWGGYCVIIIAGFISPRLIDQSLGQEILGIWDFSWSFVNYLNLAMFGLGSSINRFVAKYRAAGDSTRLDQTVSTVFCLQIVIAALVLLASGVLGWATPIFSKNILAEHTATSQWTVALLGATLAVNMAFDVFRGILTGCHRWDLHNRINSGSQLVELGGMIAVLLGGGGLRLLGLNALCIAIATGFVRVLTALKVCPELTINLKFFRWKMAREMSFFGIKSMVTELPSLLLVQTTNIFLVLNLGPASLAVFSRSIALVRHTEAFMGKFSFILTPTVGSLQGMGQEEELRTFFLASTLYGVAFAAPMLFFLIINGDLLLQFWMGDHYVHGSILTILAIGYFLPTAQNSIREILKGLNAHGKIGLINFLIACGCFLAGSILLQIIGWTINNAAILLAVSLTVSLGITPAIYACQKLNVPYNYYIRHSVIPPLLCNIVFIACMLAGRQLFPKNIIAAGGVGSTVGAVLLTLLYLLFIFPDKEKEIVKNLLKKTGRCQ